MRDRLLTPTANLEVVGDALCSLCHCQSLLLLCWPPMHLYSTLVVHTLSSLHCLQGLSAGPQVVPRPCAPCSYPPWARHATKQLWQDVDPAVAFFQAGTRTTATRTAFQISAALRDPFCRSIVSCILRCSACEPLSSIRPNGCRPAHRRSDPIAPSSPGLPESGLVEPLWQGPPIVLHSGGVALL